MYTIVENPLFYRQVREIWSDDERLAFFSYLAENPLVGDIIPQSGGMRKVRWSLSQSGKRGGARVIYFNHLADGVIEVVMIYEKKKQANILDRLLMKLKE